MAPLSQRCKKEFPKISFLISFLSPKNLVALVFNLLFNNDYFLVTAMMLYIAEIVVNIVVILKIPYTEIDWEAYMSEVGGFLNGTYDYTKLEGATGPLVYPAGFVYIFSGLFYITDFGLNIKRAQLIFAGFYLLNLALVFYIYYKVKIVPPYVMFFICCASYRIHSIFVLRLFNDPVAMIFLYASVICFVWKKWKIGCTLFSLGVSIKMNILLFAPGLLVVMLLNLSILECFYNISICALIQLLLGMPFLFENPSGYIVRSFNFGRQFFFKWTVNWRFLPEWLFLSRWFHLTLLVCHLLTLAVFTLRKWPQPTGGWFKILKEKNLVNVSPVILVKVLFFSNFIGICFARSLHYQFYVWYFHSLPFILWSVKMPSVSRLLILGIVELCWNTYPSTNLSSLTLHLCHFIVLIGNLLFEENHFKEKEMKAN